MVAHWVPNAASESLEKKVCFYLSRSSWPRRPGPATAFSNLSLLQNDPPASHGHTFGAHPCFRLGEGLREHDRDIVSHRQRGSYVAVACGSTDACVRAAWSSGRVCCLQVRAATKKRNRLRLQ